MGTVCRFVLNHLPQRLTAVDNLIASARPGGVILGEDFLPRALQRYVDQAPSDEDAQALLRFEAAYLGVLAKHGSDRYWSVRAGEVFKRPGPDRRRREGILRAVARRRPRMPDAARRAGEAVRRADRRGVKADDQHRVADLLQDPRVTVNGHVVVSARTPPRRPRTSQPGRVRSRR
jgi:hypothetical protein